MIPAVRLTAGNHHHEVHPNRRNIRRLRNRWFQVPTARAGRELSLLDIEKPDFLEIQDASPKSQKPTKAYGSRYFLDLKILPDISFN